VQALLRNLYLFYSGHPRALQLMAEALKKQEIWQGFESAIGDPEYSKPILLFKLLGKLPHYEFDINSMS